MPADGIAGGLLPSPIFAPREPGAMPRPRFSERSAQLPDSTKITSIHLPTTLRWAWESVTQIQDSHCRAGSSAASDVSSSATSSIVATIKIDAGPYLQIE